MPFLVCIAMLSYFGELPIVFAGERFKPRNCEFSIEFPGKFKIQELMVPTIGSYESAEFRAEIGGASGYVLYAEGYPVKRSDILKSYNDIKTYLSQSLNEYALANGIQSAEFRYFNDKTGEGMFMRGYKSISGQRVIYSTMSVVGKSSILAARVGAPAKDFPPPGFSQFFNSVRRE
jgi:hypothetical protein